MSKFGGGGGGGAGATLEATKLSIEFQKEALKKYKEMFNKVMETQKEMERKQTQISIDNIKNNFITSGDDYLRQQKARAMLAALTYGKPQSYVDSISLDLKNGMKKTLGENHELIGKVDEAIKSNEKAHRHHGWRPPISNDILSKNANGSVLPEIETKNGTITTQEVQDSMAAQNPFYQRKQNQLNEALKAQLSGMGIRRGSAAQAVSNADINLQQQEQDRFRNNLSQLAGLPSNMQSSMNSGAGMMNNVLGNAMTAKANAISNYGNQLGQAYNGIANTTFQGYSLAGQQSAQASQNRSNNIWGTVGTLAGLFT